MREGEPGEIHAKDIFDVTREEGEKTTSSSVYRTNAPVAEAESTSMRTRIDSAR
jgi:hypothetical protein